MTTAAVSAPTRDPARHWLFTVGALLLAGPILFDLGYALHPTLPMDVEAALADVVDVRTQHAAAKAMVAFGGLLMIALFVIYRRWLVPSRGRAVATVGTALLALGLAANSLSQSTHGYLLYWASAPEVDPAAGVDVVSEAESATALVTLPVSFWSVPVFAVGLVLVAVALWRAGSVPRWVPVGMVVAGVAAGAIGTGPLMLGVLALDVAVHGTALACAARRATAVTP
jgi:hypothetical protein